MSPEQLADLRVGLDDNLASERPVPHDIVAELLADRDRLAALLECARVVTRADECALDCDEASPCIYCRSAARLDAHFDRGAGS